MHDVDRIGLSVVVNLVVLRVEEARLCVHEDWEGL